MNFFSFRFSLLPAANNPPQSAAAYLPKNVAADSNAIHAISLRAAWILAVRWAYCQSSRQGEIPRSINRRFVRRVYFALKRRGLRGELTLSPEIDAWHSLNRSEAVRRTDASQIENSRLPENWYSSFKTDGYICALFYSLSATLCPYFAGLNACPLSCSL